MRWTAVKAFTVKELKTFLRSKESIFWMIAWPTLMVVMAAYVFIPPEAGLPRTVKVGVVNLDVETTAPFNGSAFVEILKEADYKGVRLFEVAEYANESTLKEDLKRGRLDCGFLIPRGFGAKLITGQAELRVYVGARDVQSAQMIEAILKGFIDGVNKAIAERKVNETLRYIGEYGFQMPENLTMPWANQTFTEFLKAWYAGIVSPIKASFVDVKPEAFMVRSALIGWYTIGAAGMAILYTGLSAGSLMAVEERDRGTLRRLLASPATSTDMLLGKTLAWIIVIGLSTLISITVGVLGCGAKIIWNPDKLEHWLIPTLLALVSILMIGFGMLLSLTAKTARGASALGVVIGLMLSFTAGIWFPKTWMPGWMSLIGDVFPATWAIDTIRSIMVFEAGLAEVLPDVAKVLTSSIIVYLLGVVAYRRVLRKYAET